MAVVVLVGLAAAPAFADGDVSAVVNGRTLTLFGDDLANTVTISAGGASREVTVTPGAGTTVNGVADASVFAHVRNVRVVMGDGDDTVVFDHVTLRGSVRVRLDAGDDTLRFTASTVRGPTSARCGDGVDLVRTESSSFFGGPVAIRGEWGNDALELTSARFRERLLVDAGGDDDHVLVSSVLCDPTSDLVCFGSRGLDLVEIVSSRFAHDLFVDAGPQDDRVRIASTRVEHDVACFGGNGFDDVLSLESGNTFVRVATYDAFEEGEPP
jgi:hypothetical protein